MSIIIMIQTETHGKALLQETLMWNIKVLLCTQDVTKIKVFNKLAKLQVKSVSTHEKMLSQGTLIWNIKVLLHTIHKM
jgi:hypothetical protein